MNNLISSDHQFKFLQEHNYTVKQIVYAWMQIENHYQQLNLKKQTPTYTKMQNKVSPKMYTPDQCFRYIPRHDFNTFTQQIELTNGELLNYLPSPVYQISKTFETTKRNMAIGFWAVNIVFVTFSHKIKFINRMITNQWVMFLSKGLVLGVSYLLYGEFENKAIQLHFQRVYKVVEDDYRKYKNTGDILQFNPNIKVQDIWPNCQQTLRTQPNPPNTSLQTIS